MPHRLAADAVLILHLGVVVFVIGGLVSVVIGNTLARWPGVNSMRFRLAHLAAIGFVVVQAWLGHECPLTILESWLRVQSGTAPYNQGFIQHWVHSLMFYSAPTWIFATIYSAFGACVVFAWWRYPPTRVT